MLPWKGNKYYILRVRVYTLITQHAKRMDRIILFSVAWRALPYVSTLSHKRHGFQKKVSEHQNVCLDFLYIFETFLILKRIKRDVIINMHGSSCKVPLILVRFYRNLNFLADFGKILKYKISRKICPVGAQLFHAGGRTDKHDDASKSLFAIFRPHLKFKERVGWKVSSVVVYTLNYSSCGTCAKTLTNQNSSH
jgi:hypothetical protein